LFKPFIAFLLNINQGDLTNLRLLMKTLTTYRCIAQLIVGQPIYDVFTSNSLNLINKGFLIAKGKDKVKSIISIQMTSLRF